MRPTVREREPGADDEVAHGPGHEHAVRLREREHTRGDVDADAGDVVAAPLDLTRVQPGADLQAQLPHALAKGERAADSLYYLGQALMKLGQPTQACKAYTELEEVYGTSLRPQIRQLLPSARIEAKCG